MYYTQASPKDMVIPPNEKLVSLYEAAQIGHIEGVQQEAIRLKQLAPEYTPFVNRILELAADFEYEEIVKLIDCSLL